MPTKAERKAARAAAQQDQTQQDQTAVPETAPIAVVVAKGRLRLPLGEARAHNLGFTVLQPDGAVEAAGIALTSKGTNPTRVRVYGYDNLAAGGKVPKEAKVALVPGQTGAPKGVNPAQWDKLVGMAKDQPTVAHLYDNGIVSRTVRRAYRAGAIRFIGQVAQDAAAE